MAGPSTFTGNVRFDAEVAFSGTASLTGLPANSVTDSSISATANIDYTKLAQRTLADHPIEVIEWRIHDALQSLLPTSSGTDDLGLTIGTFGSAAPYIGTGDVKASSVTRYARVMRRLPANYEAGETVNIVVTGAMITTVADTSATVDIECYEVGSNVATPSSDLCATSAQSINSLTAADKSFTITATSLAPGDMLDIRLTVAVVDSATATAVIAAIPKVSIKCDTRG